MKNWVLWSVVAVVIASSACASSNVKAHLTSYVQTSQSLSAMAQAAEVVVYQSHLVKSLTDAKQAQIAAAFARANALETDAAKAIAVWPGTGAVPASVTAYIDAATDVWVTLTPLLNDAGATGFVGKVQGWLAQVVTIAQAINATVPPALQTATK